MVESPGFPLGNAFGSSGYAGAPLVDAFLATTAVADFFIPYTSGFGISAFPLQPCSIQGGMKTSQVPTEYVRTWGLLRRGLVGHLTITMTIILPST